MNYFKILVFLQKGDKSDFGTPVDGQKEFLSSFKEPLNDIDRGYYQYRCQNYFVPIWKRILFNIVAAIGFPVAIMYYLIKRIIVDKEKPISAMIENKGMEEVIPLEVRTKYNPSTEGYNEGSSLSLDDMLFLFKLIRKAPHHPYFSFKSMMNVARYSDMIKRHQPKVMIQFGEFSFSSSILTAYCHRHNAKHIDVMHGEKIYCIKDAFFHYDECYVWSDFYINLFQSERAFHNQFIVALPPSMKIDCRKYFNNEYFADYKYYLEGYTESELKQIVASMSFAKKQGKTVKYRLHPRYSDVALLQKYVSENEIEYPKSVPILESISSTDNIVGLFTTVMAQAYFSGKNVIMDDVTYKKLYDRCAEYRYALVENVKDTLSKHQIV